MISPKLRLIREHNRLYTFVLKVLSRLPNSRKASRVFLFHDIKRQNDEVSNQFQISQESFEKFLLYYLESGFQPMNHDELSRIIVDNKREDKRFIISFDDANESVYTKAYPFLKRHKIPFIVFITKELIGKEGFLKKEQIEKLASDNLCIIGSHALHHRMFRYMSREEAKNEWIASKEFLANWLKREINIFAFPYGRIVEVSYLNRLDIRKIGYTFAFSAIEGTLNQKWFTGRFFLPRINVSEEYVEKILNKQ